MPDSASLSLPYVDTWMNYAGNIKGRPRVDVPDWSRTNLELEKHDVRIYDARAIRDQFSLDREGFVLVTHEAPLDLSGKFLKTTAPQYLASMTGMLKRLSGADVVVPQGQGLLKRYAERANIKGAIGPSRWAHMDYTAEFAPHWLDWLEGWHSLKLKDSSRFAIFQTWCCISKPPQDNTLVFCDASTLRPEDCLPFDACMAKPYDGPGNQFESALCRYNPDQRWYYFSNLTADEVIVFKGHDSDSSRYAQPMHNSADIPGLPADCEPRCSIEARFFAFWN